MIGRVLFYGFCLVAGVAAFLFHPGIEDKKLS